MSFGSAGDSEEKGEFVASHILIVPAYYDRVETFFAKLREDLDDFSIFTIKLSRGKPFE